MQNASVRVIGLIGVPEGELASLAQALPGHVFSQKREGILLVVGATDNDLPNITRIFPRHQVRLMKNLESCTLESCDTVLCWGTQRPAHWRRIGVELLHTEVNNGSPVLHLFAFKDGQWKRACAAYKEPASVIDGLTVGRDDIVWKDHQLASQYGYTKSHRRRQRQ